MSDAKHFSWCERMTALALVLGCSILPVRGGTQGSYINSLGYGRAVDNVSWSPFSLSTTSSSDYQFQPSAHASGASWPTGPVWSYCQSQGFPNYVWAIQSYVSGGATADNPKLDARVQVTAAPCASYQIDSSAVLTDALSGVISVHASATAGAAVWLRGYEYRGAGDPLTLEDLIANADLKFDHLMVGPFGTDPDCPLRIPFTTQRGHEKLFFVADGVAKSTPMTISCPDDIVLGCSSPLAYPAEISGGCGPISLDFVPPAAQLVPGVPTLVTAVATDTDGNSATCQFTATRESLAFDGFYPPIGGTGGTCANPLRTINRGSAIPVKFSATCNGLPLLSGEPKIEIQLMNAGTCQPAETIETGNFHAAASEWHFIWDTTGVQRGIYRLSATLQDGSVKTVHVRLR